jgi:hypothetical protein
MSSGFSFASLVAVLMFAVLLAMFVGGIVLLVKSRRGGPAYPSCGACGYDMTGSIGEVSRCPECGADVAVAGIVPPGGQRSRARIVIGSLLVAISVSCVGATLIPALLMPLRTQPTPVPAPAPPPPPASASDGPAAPPSE